MDREQPVISTEHIPERLKAPMIALATVAERLAMTIARGPLGGALGEAVGENTDGDQQKALDVMADDEFAEALQGSGVRWYASEEQEEVVAIDKDGPLALAIDPLDGSSNIDVNVSIGTLFSIYEAKDDPNESFLRPVNEQIAAGYFIYGPQGGLVVTFGDGTLHYVLDPETRSFVLVNERVQIPTESTEYAINASNYRHWQPPVRAFIDDCIAGAEGPRATNFNMRWVASLVAETHRILSRGGVFLYPSDDRKGYERGRLRMVYECAPVAMVIEQAGGKATDGVDPILNQSAVQLHGRTPLIFGSADNVTRIATYHELPPNEVSALFGSRGLFRT